MQRKLSRILVALMCVIVSVSLLSGCKKKDPIQSLTADETRIYKNLSERRIYTNPQSLRVLEIRVANIIDGKPDFSAGCKIEIVGDNEEGGSTNAVVYYSLNKELTNDDWMYFPSYNYAFRLETDEAIFDVQEFLERYDDWEKVDDEMVAHINKALKYHWESSGIN